MAKGNQAAKKAQDLTKLNADFDTISKVLDEMADRTREIMPLVADSLDHTRKLVKLYKDSFNAGLKK